MRPRSLAFVLALAGACAPPERVSVETLEAEHRRHGCDPEPTGVARTSHFLPFTIPAGLLPDARFDGREAQLKVHRVSPVYARGKCPGVPTQAAVLIHGRTIPASASFDLRLPVPGAPGEVVSLLEALARAGIDAFAPDLLGYGGSTRFAEVFDDPHNASRRGFLPDGRCGRIDAATGQFVPFPEGCDRSPVPPVWPLDQQGNPTFLGVNPLGGQRAPHTSDAYFATTDTYARDVRHVVEDTVERARPDGHKVVLIGYSAGGARVARVLDPTLPENHGTLRRVSRAVFVSSLFGGPTELADVPILHTFPLHVSAKFNPADGAGVCAGRVMPGYANQSWTQALEDDLLGPQWGGSVPGQPAGLLRTPTFANYGWNETVAARLRTPSLVIQGMQDTGLGAPPLHGVQSACKIYDSLPGEEDMKKLLLMIECGSHQALQEGTNLSTWRGPHAVIKEAIVEWVLDKRVQGHKEGSFRVDTTGTAVPATCPIP